MHKQHTTPNPPPMDARLLAAAITLNGEQLERAEITRETWHATQMTLWNVAATLHLASAVFALVAPSGTERAKS